MRCPTYPRLHKLNVIEGLGASTAHAEFETFHLQIGFFEPKNNSILWLKYCLVNNEGKEIQIRLVMSSAHH